MNGSKALALASLPVAAGMAWRRYREAVRDIHACPARAPQLPGLRRTIDTSWGSVAYRVVQGDPSRAPLVLVHGWGKTADSAWWPIIADCDRSMVVIDLPGHGQSQLQLPFTFDLAAEAVERVVREAELVRPVLVGHSMGGPVVLTAVRRAPNAYSGVVAMATSGYWVRPRLRVMMAMAPYAMAARSPVLVHKQRSELRDAPGLAAHIAWSYSRRPTRHILEETAAMLRRFDARAWSDLAMPPATWVIATDDGVLSPEHQLASARHFDAQNIVEVAAEHSLVVQAPDAVLKILEEFRSG